jgi:hypothetical protein
VLFFALGRKTTQRMKIRGGQIDAAQFQPASASVAAERGGFRPARPTGGYAAYV